MCVIVNDSTRRRAAAETKLSTTPSTLDSTVVSDVTTVVCVPLLAAPPVAPPPTVSVVNVSARLNIAVTNSALGLECEPEVMVVCVVCRLSEQSGTPLLLASVSGLPQPHAPGEVLAGSSGHTSIAKSQSSPSQPSAHKHV